MVELVETNMSLTYKHLEHTVVFPLKLVNKRNLTIEHQTDILNKYLYYKDYEYRDKLFKILKNVHDEITVSSSSKILENIETIEELIDFISVEDIKIFLVDVYKMKIPKNIISEFSTEMKEDGRWSQEQTFTVEDYKNLTAEAIRLKILLGPLNYYYYVNFNKFKPTSVEFTIVNILLVKILENSEAIKKVMAMVGKLITGIDFRPVIIDKGISEDRLDSYVTSIIMLQRIATATIVNDNESKNIITTIYSYGYNKLTISGDISKIIREKIPDTKNDTESSSDIESYKAVTATTPGDITKILWVTKSLESIIFNSPTYLQDNVNLQEVKKIQHNIFSVFKDDSISDFTKRITGMIFNKTINPRSLDSLKIEDMSRLMTIGYQFMIEIGFKDIAELYISREIKNNEISISSYKKKDKTILANLETLYLGKGEEKIDKLNNNLLENNWMNYKGIVKIPENIINDLMSLYITVQTNYNN